MAQTIFQSKHPPVDLERYKDHTYGSFLQGCIREHPDSIIVDTSLNVTITYKKLDDLSLQFANIFEGLGFLPHDVAHIYADNSILWSAACIGCQYKGLITSASHTTSPGKDLNRNLKATNSSLLITTTEKWDAVKNQFSNEKLSWVITCREIVNENGHYEIQTEKIFLKEICHSDDDDLNDVCYMVMSSGSTGTPKVIALQSHYCIGLAILFCHPTSIHVLKGESLSVLQPFPHIGGFTGNFAPFIYAGASLYFIRTFDDSFIDKIVKYKIQHVFAVAAIFTYLTTSKLVKTSDFAFVKSIVTGGSLHGAEVHKKAVERVGKHVKLINVYGMSEACPLFSSFTISKAGYVSPNGSFKLVSLENPDICSNPGEICVKGLPMFKCYYRDEEKTKLCFTKDGFFRTGDYGRVEEDGELEILSRTKEVIKFRGYIIFPPELENYLNAHPSVQSSAVVGKTDEVNGELPVAFVVLRDEVSTEALKEHVKSEVPEYKRLHHIKILKEMPLNNNKKIDKIFLKKEAEACFTA